MIQYVAVRLLPCQNVELARLGFLIDKYEEVVTRCPGQLTKQPKEEKSNRQFKHQHPRNVEKYSFPRKRKQNITIPLVFCTVSELILGRDLHRKPSASRYKLLAVQYITPSTLQFHTLHGFNSYDGGLRWRIFYQCSSPSPPVHRKFLPKFQPDSRANARF